MKKGIIVIAVIFSLLILVVGVPLAINECYKAGGYIIHAHPFLEEDWISHIQLFPQKEDAVEIMNTLCRKIPLYLYPQRT